MAAHPSATSWPRHSSSMACTNRKHHLLWQQTTHARPGPCSKDGETNDDAGRYRCPSIQMLAVGNVSTRQRMCRFVSLPVPASLACDPQSFGRLPSPLAMHGFNQNATRLLTDIWCLKHRRSSSPCVLCSCYFFSPPTLCMDLKWCVGFID